MENVSMSKCRWGLISAIAIASVGLLSGCVVSTDGGDEEDAGLVGTITGGNNGNSSSSSGTADQDGGGTGMQPDANGGTTSNPTGSTTNNTDGSTTTDAGGDDGSTTNNTNGSTTNNTDGSTGTPDAGMMDIGGTGGDTGSDPQTCEEILLCEQSCQQQNGCNCAQRAPSNARSNYQALISCVSNNCPQQQSSCIRNSCGSEAQTCGLIRNPDGGTTTGSTTGDGGGTGGSSIQTCYGFNSCIGYCNSDSCQRTVANATVRQEAQTYVSLSQCANSNCSNASDQTSCLEKNCSQSYDACFGWSSSQTPSTCGEIQLCQSDSGIQQCLDNNCPNATSQSQLQQCIQNNCTSEYQAYQACEQNAPPSAAQQYNALLQCEDQNCSNAQNPLECVRQNCTSQHKSCYGCPSSI